VITGFHTIVYSEDPEATRRFFREVLQWPSLDAGGGWLIFKTPPGELGVHPTADDSDARWATVPFHQATLMCDDIGATIVELRSRGVEVREDVQDQGFGLVTSLDVPGAGWLMLYQPRHGLAYELEG
jgi:catechol 2,3-dioxygenase-like lactoylglutathione lyase family enzyme